MKHGKIALYGILTATAMIFGYIENLFPLSFIAPGIKPGIANSVCLILLLNNDFKGALLVNTARIMLTALLFSTPFSLLFSLTAGIVSLLVSFLVSRLKSVTAAGFGIAGAAAHNITQIFVASLIFGRGIWYYLPFLLTAALIFGGAVGIISLIIFKKVKTKLNL